VASAPKVSGSRLSLPWSSPSPYGWRTGGATETPPEDLDGVGAKALPAMLAQRGQARDVRDPLSVSQWTATTRAVRFPFASDVA
jgi:hypothetical protein